MEIIIQSTKEFEQDLEALSNAEQETIINQMNQNFQLLLNEPEFLFNQKNLTQTKKLNLKNNYDSSLYSLRVNPNFRVILTIDDDPIFDRKDITLFRVVNSVEASKAYNKVADDLYKDLMIEQEKVEFQPR